ncbi:MAG: V-type ATP synthase subunit E [Victivallales bacterium]|nr:V-type ATP synthase subunit E [Victivallales bacterium]
MPEKNQEEKLRQEILGDAKLNAERIVARAKNEAQKTIDAAQAEVDQKRAERLSEANEDTEAKCHSIMLDVQRESMRHWLLQREQCIDDMFQEAVKQASETTGEAHKKSLQQLAEEALSAIGAADMRVIFNSKDAAIITEPWLRAIAEKLFGEKTAQITFTLEPGDDTPAGIAFATIDGARTFDNSYAARLRHMKDTLRITLS